eukprot:7747095-Lingulodinium_polyedra.AAC.1
MHSMGCRMAPVTGVVLRQIGSPTSIPAQLDIWSIVMFGVEAQASIDSWWRHWCCILGTSGPPLFWPATWPGAGQHPSYPV